MLPRDARATFTPLRDLVTPGQSPVLGIELVDPVGGPTMADSIEVPGEGTWRVDDSTGVITFDPLASFVGEVTPLGYAAWDENGNSARAVLRVTYEAPPTPGDATVPVPPPHHGCAGTGRADRARDSRSVGPSQAHLSRAHGT